MKLQRKLWLPALLLLAPLSAADGLRPERIPEGTTWVAHVDVEGFEKTKLWANLKGLQGEMDLDLQTTFEFDEILGNEEIPESTRQRLAGLDFQLFRDLKSVTIAGTEGELEDNVAILDVSGLASDVLAALQDVPGYQRKEHKGLELHTFTDTETNKVEGAIYLHASERDRGSLVAVVSQHIPKLMQTARVLRKEEPALRRDLDQHLLLNPQASSLVYFEASGPLPGLDDVDEASVVTKFAKSLHFDMGERDGYLEARIQVGTEDANKAIQISQMLQGLVAMASLAADEPEIKSLAQVASALSFKTDRSLFIIDFEFESYELVQILKSLDQH